MNPVSNPDASTGRADGRLFVAGLVFVVLGLFFLFSGIRMVLFPESVIDGAIADATVVGFETRVSSDSDGNTHEVDWPVYEFVDRSGVTHRVTANAYGILHDVSVGDSTIVTYDPESPDARYEIASEEGLDIIATVVQAVVGGAFVAVGVVLMRKSSM